MNHKELLEDFLIWEREEGLFDLRLNHIPIWEYLRFQFFSSLKENYVPIKTTTDKDPTKVLRATFHFFKNVFLKNPFSHRKKTDILIVNHSRRKKKGEFFEDIYTDPFLPFLQSDYIVLENFYNLRHETPVNTNNLFYLDIIEFPSRLISFSPFSKQLLNSDKDKFNRFQDSVIKKWPNLNFNLSGEVVKLIKRHNYLFPRINKLIKKLGPSKIVMVVSYKFINQLITEVAKQNNIPVFELQHGTVGKYHLGYNYPSEINNTLTFPDYFLAWGNYWIENSRMPINRKNQITAGFPYINKFKSIVKNSSKKEIIVLSQLREDIADFTLELASKLPEYTIIFKAHPAEYSVAKERYANLIQCKNIKLIADDKISLYDLFQKSSSVIGVCSTALIEALAFCDTIFIVKLPGWEYFEDLKESENIRFVQSVKEVNHYLHNIKSTKEKKSLEYYFKNQNIQSFCNFLSINKW